MAMDFLIKSIIYVGTRQIGADCLLHLLNTIKDTNTRVVGVLTSSKKSQLWSKPGKLDVWEIAEQHGLAIITESELLELNYDMLFCSIYLKIFSEAILARAQYYNINLHPAPLPDYRGCWGYPHAIINGEKVFGSSLHFMNTEADAGDIIDVQYFPISNNETSLSLSIKTHQNSLILFQKWLVPILEGKVRGIDQDIYAKQQRRKMNYYSYHSLDSYFTQPVEVANFNELERLKRALHFPPYFDVPDWLKDAGVEIKR